jgi:hypothetical protein
MRTMRKISLAILLIAIAAGTSFAADNASHDVTINVAEVIELAVTAGTITLTADMAGGGVAGDDPVGDSDTSKTIQYTSIWDGATARTIEAQLAGGDTAPAGTSLTLSAAGGEGVKTLVDGPAVAIITGIQSVATGGTGPALTYAISITNVSNLVAGASETVTVTLTLTDL